MEPFCGCCCCCSSLAFKRELCEAYQYCLQNRGDNYLFWPAGSRFAKPIPMQFEFGESFKAAAFLECCLVTWSNVISALSKNSHWRVRHEGIKEKNARGTFEGRCLLYPGDTAGVMWTVSVGLKFHLFSVSYFTLQRDSIKMFKLHFQIGDLHRVQNCSNVRKVDTERPPLQYAYCIFVHFLCPQSLHK